VSIDIQIRIQLRSKVKTFVDTTREYFEYSISGIVVGFFMSSPEIPLSDLNVDKPEDS